MLETATARTRPRTSGGSYGEPVIVAVLGAPGSGKSTVIRPLRSLLPAHIIVDWDDFMEPAAALAGRDIRQDPDTWPAYRQLVRAVLDTVARWPVVLLGVGTPAELPGWPIAAWVLLDCTDEERRRRMNQAGRLNDLREAIDDARQYRTLGLPVIDTTARTPTEVAAGLADLIQRAGPA